MSNSSTTTSNTNTKTISLVISATSLLSADNIQGCRSPEDATCKGGAATVAAYARHHNAKEGIPMLVAPRLDTWHPLVQMHPLGWNLNQKVLQEHFGLSMVTAARPSLLLLDSDNNDSNHSGPRDLSGLQTPELSLLWSNVAVPPTSSWHPYVESVHFDSNTGIALIYIVEETNNNNNNTSNMNWSYPQAASAMTALNYIASKNKRQNCESNTNMTATAENACWIPIILVEAPSREGLDAFVSAVSSHETPPALIVDTASSGTKDNNFHGTSPTPTVTGDGIWVVHQPWDRYTYHCNKLTIDTATRQVMAVTTLQEDLTQPLPVALQDDQYMADLAYLRRLADEAIEHDPVVGRSNIMPGADQGQCWYHECPMGNLVTDSIRWKAQADVAFLSGTRFQGPGWPFGQVHVSDVWNMLPEPMTLCQGRLSGATLLRIMDYALKTLTTWDGTSDSSASIMETLTTWDETRNSSSASIMEPAFLQISGFRVIYNMQVAQKNNSTSLVAVQALDPTTRAFTDINPMRMYTVVTDSGLCTDNNNSANRPGENDEKRRFLLNLGSFLGDHETMTVGDDLVQNSVGELLSQLSSTYVPALEGRLLDDPEATTRMNLDSMTTGGCGDGMYWNDDTQSCIACPSSESYVSFSDNEIHFKFADNSDDRAQTSRLVVVNHDLHDYVLVAEEFPAWFTFTGATSLTTSSNLHLPRIPLKLIGGTRVAFDFDVNASNLKTDSASSTILFNITDSIRIPACPSSPNVFPINISVQTTPNNTIIELGNSSVAGMVTMGILITVSLLLALWVFVKRERWGYGPLGDKNIKSIQPLYLGTICIGVMILALSLIPLSLQETDTSRLCVVTPMVFFLGVTIVLSALLSKLSTAKKVLNKSNMRTVHVSRKELAMPFAVLTSINFILLFSMMADPPSRVIETLPGEDSDSWQFYSVCQQTSLSSSLLISTVVVQILALCWICFQSYQVSQMTNEFHELKNIGIVAFLWLELAIIVIPVSFIMDPANVIGSYYFKVMTIAALCLSMLLCIFVPVLFKTSPNKEMQLDDENQKAEGDSSIFGGFMGFSALTGSLASRKGIPLAEEDKPPSYKYEDTRCFADNVCRYY